MVVANFNCYVPFLSILKRVRHQVPDNLLQSWFVGFNFDRERIFKSHRKLNPLCLCLKSKNVQHRHQRGFQFKQRNLGSELVVLTRDIIEVVIDDAVYMRCTILNHLQFLTLVLVLLIVIQ